MELKKNDKANLEKRKTIFLQLGLVIVLALMLIAFEWTTGGLKDNEYDMGDTEQLEEEMIPITEQQQPEPPKPPEPPKTTELFEIVEDDIEIEDEFIIEEDEIDMDTEVEIIEYTIEEEEEEEEDNIFVIVEEMPTFRGGGVEKFRSWVFRNLKYPPIASENGVQGRVYVDFVVEPTGEVSNVKVVRGVDPSLDKEAIRVVSSSPKWKPGKQRGLPVRVRFSFPILFELQ